MEWQPIETAPKDKPILVSGGTYVYDDYDTVAPFKAVTIAYWCYDHWHGDQREGHDNWNIHEPTHWMPLPEPPTSSIR